LTPNGQYQFRDGIAEAKEHARKYIDHLQNEFKDHVETVEKNELRLKSSRNKMKILLAASPQLSIESAESNWEGISPY